MNRLLVVLLLLSGCKAQDDVPQTPIHHDFGDDAGYWDAPWPSEHRRHADGTVDVAAFPNPDAVPFVTTLVELADGQLEGFGTTSPIFFTSAVDLDTAAFPDLWASVETESPVFVMGIDPGGDDHGVRVPLNVSWRPWGGAFGDQRTLALLPLQGRPLRPATLYAAVVLREIGDEDGNPLGLLYEDGLPEAYLAALDALDELGVPRDTIAGLAVFRTQDPRAGMLALAEAAAQHPPSPIEPFQLTDLFDEYCVYQTVVEMPVYQEGEPPYLSGGGGIALDDQGAPVLQHLEQARLVITIPRAQAPEHGWPSAVFIRTGGGGDRPLVDRGVRDAEGQVLVPGSGPARNLALAGFAGVSVDGPHGGLRNVSGGDEQFLIFNITNPAAMRDNLRQSAAELTLLPDLLDELELDLAECPGASTEGRTFDFELYALMGHSMGATIAPLTLAAQPDYGAVVLSGAGGSWIENIVHKLSPLEVRPMAEAMLGYSAGDLTVDDPVLALLQWAGESADPPVYAPGLVQDETLNVLMIQGIVDTYILPPMANATSLSLGLDLAGESLDAGHPELGEFRPLEDVIGLVGRGTVGLPAHDNIGINTTAVVVQHLEDGVEDGHEVMFQTGAPKHQYRCFLEGWRQGTPKVVVGGGEEDDCGGTP